MPSPPHLYIHPGLASALAKMFPVPDSPDILRGLPNGSTAYASEVIDDEVYF